MYTKYNLIILLYISTIIIRIINYLIILILKNIHEQSMKKVDLFLLE